MIFQAFFDGHQRDTVVAGQVNFTAQLTWFGEVHSLLAKD